MNPAYYNEIDPYCCQWLRNLIAAGHIPAGEVDERDIRDVRADDLAGFGQCHFFAGIGGFAFACRLAGWPDDRQIWTGGFPCQPFSVAGDQKGKADARHLWPELSRLIAQGKPAAFLGENVAGIVPLALDGVLFDLESHGYACQSFVIPACAIDAPHRRDRVWIVADSNSDRLRKQSIKQPECEGKAKLELVGEDMADAESERCREARTDSERHQERFACSSALDNADGKSSFWSAESRSESGNRRVKSGVRLLANGIPARVAKLRAFGNAIVPQVAAEVIRAMI